VINLSRLMLTIIRRVIFARHCSIEKSRFRHIRAKIHARARTVYKSLQGSRPFLIIPERWWRWLWCSVTGQFTRKFNSCAATCLSRLATPSTQWLGNFRASVSKLWHCELVAIAHSTDFWPSYGKFISLSKIDFVWGKKYCGSGSSIYLNQIVY
jgi:hypothetical protein